MNHFLKTTLLIAAATAVSAPAFAQGWYREGYPVFGGYGYGYGHERAYPGEYGLGPVYGGYRSRRITADDSADPAHPGDGRR